MSRWKVATSSADNIRLNTTSQYDHLKYCQWALYMFYNILYSAWTLVFITLLRLSNDCPLAVRTHHTSHNVSQETGTSYPPTRLLSRSLSHSIYCNRWPPSPLTGDRMKQMSSKMYFLVGQAKMPTNKSLFVMQLSTKQTILTAGKVGCITRITRNMGQLLELYWVNRQSLAVSLLQIIHNLVKFYSSCLTDGSLLLTGPIQMMMLWGLGTVTGQPVNYLVSLYREHQTFLTQFK